MTDHYKKTEVQRPRLIKSAFVSAQVNNALVTNSFNAVANIDITGIDKKRIEVFVYGHRLDGGNDYATVPNQGTLALVGSNVLLAGYNIANNSVQIGYFNPNPGFTPAAPYKTVYLSYFIFAF